MTSATPTPEAPVARLSREALAERAGADVVAVDRLADVGILAPAEGALEPFTPGDVYRVRFVSACERAGMPAEAIGLAMAEGRLSLSFMDLPHYRWSALAGLTYAELAEQMELPIDLVLNTFMAVRNRKPVGSSSLDTRSHRSQSRRNASCAISSASWRLPVTRHSAPNSRARFSSKKASNACGSSTPPPPGSAAGTRSVFHGAP
jgi:hypothetical protein